MCIFDIIPFASSKPIHKCIIFNVMEIVWLTWPPIGVGRRASCDPAILLGTFPSSIWWHVSITNPITTTAILSPHPLIFSRIIDTKHRCTRIWCCTISIALIPSTASTARVESWTDQITTFSILYPSRSTGHLTIAWGNNGD